MLPLCSSIRAPEHTAVNKDVNMFLDVATFYKNWFD